MSADLNTEIKIGADASGVEAGVGKAKRSLKSLGDAAQQAGKDAGAGMGAIGAGGDKSAKDVERATRTMQNSIQRLIAEQKAGAKGSREYWEALANTRGVNTAALRPLLDQLDAAKSATNAAKGAAESWRDSLGKIGPMVAAAFSGAALAGFIGKVVSVQREFDVLNSSLKTVTGSSAAAEREMAWLKDFAKATPFGLAQATQGFVKMKALGLDPTRAALTSFGNTASAMGKDLNQMIEAVADASTGEFERLKEFGIKAKKEGDQVSLTFQGVTTTIGNSAREITKYLEDIGNTSFGGAMEERAKTLDGTIAALGDTWDELFRTVSTNNIGGLIFDSVTLANGVLEDATTIIRAMGGAVGETSREFGSLSAIQGGVATFFETVSVLAANTLYVLRQTGDTMAGVAAGYKAFFSFDFDAVRAIGAEMKANGEAARKEIDATTARILNARKAQEEYARYATRNASAATDPRRVDLGGSTTRKPVAGVDSKGINAANKELADQAKLIAELNGLTGSFAKEWDTLSAVYKKGEMSLEQLTSAQAALLAKQPAIKAFADEQNKAQQSLAKANLDAAASREKYLTSLSTGLDKIQADIAAQIEATERMGLSKEAIAELDAAKLEMLATDLELQAIKAMDRNLDQQTYDALKKQAAAYRELGIAKKGGAAKEAALEMEKANAEAAKKAQEDWERASEQINRSLTDALLRGFESGKDFAKNLRDTIKNMFSTLVLRPIISAVMTPVSMAANGVVQGGMNAVGLGGGGNLMGMASNASSLNTLWGAGSQAIFGGTAGASAASLGYANLVGAVGGDAIGALAAGNGMWAGVAVEAGATAGAAAGAAAIEAGAVAGGAAAGGAGAAGAGLTGALSAIPVWGWAAMAGLALVGSGAFDSRGANHSGGVYSTKDTDRNAAAAGLGLSGDALGDFTQRGNTAIDAQLGAAVGALSGVYQSLSKYAGDSAKQIDIVAGFAVNGKHKDEDAYGYFKLLDKLTGETLASYSKRDGGLGSDPAKAWEQYVTDMGTALVDEIRKADIPGWMDGILASFGEEVTGEELTLALQQIQAVDVAFGLLGVNMELAGRSADGFSGNIVNAMGGLEKFQTAISGYYENYYSGTERLNAGAGELAKGFDELGVAMPRSRQELRGMITATLEAGESGQELAVSLLNASVNFDNFADSLMSMSGLTTDSIKGIFENILEQANSAQEAESMAADAFSSMIMDSMQNAMMTGLSDMVMSSLVAPLMEGMLAGAVTSSTVLASGGATAAASMAAGGAYAGAANAGGGASAASSMASGGASAATSMASGGAAAGGLIGSFLDTAKTYLTGFAAVMNDPEVQAAMAELGKTFGSTAGSLYSMSGSGYRAPSFGGGGGGGGGGGKSEADNLAASMKKLGEVIGDEIKRLTGAMDDFDPKRGRDSLLSEFAINTAKARSGDTGALDTLSKLSKEIESATKLTAASALDLNATRGWLAASLADTLTSLKLDLPKFAVGTNYVPRTMAAVIHEGEAIVPKAYNPWASGGAPQQSNARLEALVTQLIEDNRTQAGEIARLQARVARVVEKWDGDGLPAEREEASV